MAKHVKDTIRFRVVTVDPDGSMCHLCGDYCYLEQFKLGIETKYHGKHLIPIYSFCTSCVDDIREWCDEDD